MEHFKPNLDGVHATTPESASSERSTSSRTLPKVDLSPIDRGTAAKLVRRLLAGYPSLNAHDPEGYIAALVQVMAEYPIWAGEMAILKVDSANAAFPPTDRQLRSWLNDSVRPWRYAAEWDARSHEQIAARPKMEEPLLIRGTKGDGGPGTIYSNFDEAFEKHGRPIGVFESDGRQVPYKG